MSEDQHRNSRREVLRSSVRGIGLLGLGGVLWGTVANKLKASDIILRPPGAIEEKDFVKACIRCGTCVESCPYDTLKLATLNDRAAIGTPFFEPRSTPCYMCVEVPCVPVCPSSALDIQEIAKEVEGVPIEDPDIKKSRMGVAVIDENTCLAYWGIRCDACYRACPLIDEAVTLEYKRNENTGKHAILEPHVHQDVCTGCGVCEHVCITEKAAIFVLPHAVASGKVGAHYIKSWDRNDEDRIQDPTEDDDKERKPEDILNEWEELLDDD